MWKCPKCSREFKNTNQSHFCGEKPKTIEEYILSIPYGKIDEKLIEKIAKWCLNTENHV